MSQRGKAVPPPKRKGKGIVWAGLAAAAALLLALGFERVAPGERVFRVAGGEAAPLAPGLHFHLPLTGRTIRLGAGPIVVRGEVPLRSSEGAALVAAYEISAGLPDAAAGRVLARAGSAGGIEEAVRGTAVSGIEAWGRGQSGEAIALGEGRTKAEEEIRGRLVSEGFDPVQVRVTGSPGSTEMQAKLAAEAIRNRSEKTGLRVAILGLDGADWEILDPLIKAGRAPNLARLKARSAYGPMKSMDPMLSPILWTTAATGRPPEQHGVIDFLVRDAAGKPTPVSSRARKVKALWNILGDVGRSSAFIGWWATWPAEDVNGTMVSDRVAYSTFSFAAALKDGSGATWPAEYFQRLRPLLVQPDDIPDQQLRRFADATHDEFRRLAGIVAGARSYHAAALDLLKQGQPDLFSIYYQGIDEVGHRFQHFMPPKMEMVSAGDFARYRGTVEAYYVYQDELLGQVLDRLDRDTVVIVMSDHGFRNGTGRPPNDPPYVEGKPGLWHRRYGIFMMAGPQVKPGPLDTTSLLDIAPTALYLLGLPKGEDMPGRVVEEAIDPGFLARVPRRTIPTYESVGRPLQPPLVAGGTGQGEVEKEMMEKLRSLGYIGGEGGPGAAGGPAAAGGGSGALAEGAPSSPGAATLGGEALITAHVNEATLRLKAKDYARAEASVAEALKLAPDFIPALLLKAQIARERKDYATAIATARRVIEIDGEGERQTYSQIARLYGESGHVDEGLQFLRSQVAAHPDLAEARAALGALLLKSGDKAGAERELLASLQADPSLSDPLTELHTLYQGTAKIPTLEGIVRKGLALNEQSVVHHNWMGLILEWNKDLPGAEREYRRAMELDPDYAPTMANLGALYGRSQRLDEAVAILKRAVAKDDSNLEAWVNLGAAQGRMNHPKEAIVALETARGKGMRTTTLYNALALSYLQDGQPRKAVDYLQESLVIDPGQKEAQALLAEVKRRAS